MSKRHMWGFLLAFLSVLSTISLSLAYWASQVFGNDSTYLGEITLGEGDPITTTVIISGSSSGGILVPSGRANDEGEVESVVLTADVNWQSDDALGRGAEGTEGTLNVLVDQVTFDGVENATIESYVQIALPTTTAIIADGDAVTVTITITLLEPETQALYALLANKEIAITFLFQVTI